MPQKAFQCVLGGRAVQRVEVVENQQRAAFEGRVKGLGCVVRILPAAPEAGDCGREYSFEPSYERFGSAVGALGEVPGHRCACRNSKLFHQRCFAGPRGSDDETETRAPELGQQRRQTLTPEVALVRCMTGVGVDPPTAARTSLDVVMRRRTLSVRVRRTAS